MAEIAFTKPERAPFLQTYNWAGVTKSDTCKPIKVERPLFAYSVQASGTFGSATVALHGSLDGSNYVALKDRNGTAIGLTAAGLASGLDIVLYLKPVISGGTSQSIDVSLMVGFRQ